jgi:hypothetical protein
MKKFLTLTTMIDIPRCQIVELTGSIHLYHHLAQVGGYRPYRLCVGNGVARLYRHRARSGSDRLYHHWAQPHPYLFCR